jgi:hypothetical protein
MNYRYSPIKSEKELDRAWEYLVREISRLSEVVTGEPMPATILKLFAHYPDEYEYLRAQLLEYGEAAPISSKTSLYVKVDRKIAGQQVNYLGVRIVDPYRMQVGCGDYEVEDYDQFVSKWVGKKPFVRDIATSAGIPLIELWDPDFDVLGYVIRPLASRA